MILSTYLKGKQNERGMKQAQTDDFSSRLTRMVDVIRTGIHARGLTIITGLTNFHPTKPLI